MPSAHDAVSPVIYSQNAWPSQPHSPNVDQGQYAHSPVGSVASSHNNIGSPLSHAGAGSPLGVCSPTAVHSPHMQAHSPVMQAGSPLQCPQPLSINVSIKQEMSGAAPDYNNLTHLLRGGPPHFSNVAFANGLGCHMGPPAQREILDGELFVWTFVPKKSQSPYYILLFTHHGTDLL